MQGSQQDEELAQQAKDATSLCPGCAREYLNLPKHMKCCCPELLPQQTDEQRAERKQFSESDWISEEEVKEAALASFDKVSDPLLRKALLLRFGADQDGRRRTPCEVADAIGGKYKGNAQAGLNLVRNALRSVPLVADDPTDLEVLYEDDDVLAVSKPPFLRATPVHRFMGKSLTNQLVGHLQLSTENANASAEPRLMHRLDQQTSGVVLCAKSTQAAASLQAIWHTAECEKRYLAIAPLSDKAELPASIGEQRVVDVPIGKDITSSDPVRRAVNHTDGQTAKTRFEVLAVGKSAMLLACTLEESGRTHQIRVHAAHLGLPLIGDGMYGGHTGEFAGIDRVSLHAWRLRTLHPTSRTSMSIEAPLPDDMNRCLQAHGVDWMSRPDAIETC